MSTLNSASVAVKRVQPFFAIRVVISFSDGTGQVQRDYVRTSSQHVGEQKFTDHAVGDLIGLIWQGYPEPAEMTNGSPARSPIQSITVEEISAVTARENMRYRHTTHTTHT